MNTACDMHFPSLRKSFCCGVACGEDTAFSHKKQKTATCFSHHTSNSLKYVADFMLLHTLKALCAMKTIESFLFSWKKCVYLHVLNRYKDFETAAGPVFHTENLSPTYLQVREGFKQYRNGNITRQIGRLYPPAGVYGQGSISLLPRN